MINPAWLKQNYNQGYLDTATVNTPSGKILGGVFQRVNAKGLVLYPKKAFDAAGTKLLQHGLSCKRSWTRSSKTAIRLGVSASSPAQPQAGPQPTGPSR